MMQVDIRSYHDDYKKFDNVGKYENSVDSDVRNSDMYYDLPKLECFPKEEKNVIDLTREFIDDDFTKHKVPNEEIKLMVDVSRPIDISIKKRKLPHFLNSDNKRHQPLIKYETEEKKSIQEYEAMKQEQQSIDLDNDDKAYKLDTSLARALVESWTIDRDKFPKAKHLLPWQVEHVIHMLAILLVRNRALDASDAGVGKTFMTVLLCLLLGLKPFIHCPKSIILHWMQELKDLGVEYYGISNYEMILGCKYYSKNSGLNPINCPYIIKHEIVIPATDKSPELKTVQYQYKLPADCILVFDEAHKGKNYKTQTSKLIQAACNLPNKALLLSATITDKIECFKPFGLFLGFYDDVQRFSVWLRRAVNITRLQHDSIGLTDNQRKLDVIHHAIFPEFGHRITKKDLQDILPENKIVAKCYYLANSYEVNRLWSELREAMRELKDKSTRSAALGKIVILRQNIELLKIPIFLEEVDKLLAEGFSIVIFTNFTETLLQLSQKLKCDCLIYGNQSLEERSVAVNRFQTNESRIIICNVQAGGVGISLDDTDGKHPRRALINPVYSGIYLKQLQERLNRATSKSDAFQSIIYVAGSYEEKMCEIVNYKIQNLNGINDANHFEPDMSVEKINELESELQELTSDNIIKEEVAFTGSLC